MLANMSLPFCVRVSHSHTQTPSPPWQAKLPPLCPQPHPQTWRTCATPPFWCVRCATAPPACCTRWRRACASTAGGWESSRRVGGQWWVGLSMWYVRQHVCRNAAECPVLGSRQLASFVPLPASAAQPAPLLGRRPGTSACCTCWCVGMAVMQVEPALWWMHWLCRHDSSAPAARLSCHPHAPCLIMQLICAAFGLQALARAHIESVVLTDMLAAVNACNDPDCRRR